MHVMYIKSKHNGNTLNGKAVSGGIFKGYMLQYWSDYLAGRHGKLVYSVVQNNLDSCKSCISQMNLFEDQ